MLFGRGEMVKSNSNLFDTGDMAVEGDNGRGLIVFSDETPYYSTDDYFEYIENIEEEYHVPRTRAPRFSFYLSREGDLYEGVGTIRSSTILEQFPNNADNPLSFLPYVSVLYLDASANLTEAAMATLRKFIDEQLERDKAYRVENACDVIGGRGPIFPSRPFLPRSLAEWVDKGCVYDPAAIDSGAPTPGEELMRLSRSSLFKLARGRIPFKEKGELKADLVSRLVDAGVRYGDEPLTEEEYARAISRGVERKDPTPPSSEG